MRCGARCVGGFLEGHEQPARRGLSGAEGLSGSAEHVRQGRTKPPGMGRSDGIRGRARREGFPEGQGAGGVVLLLVHRSQSPNRHRLPRGELVAGQQRRDKRRHASVHEMPPRDEVNGLDARLPVPRMLLGNLEQRDERNVGIGVVERLERSIAFGFGGSEQRHGVRFSKLRTSRPRGRHPGRPGRMRDHAGSRGQRASAECDRVFHPLSHPQTVARSAHGTARAQSKAMTRALRRRQEVMHRVRSCRGNEGAATVGPTGQAARRDGPL